MCLCFGVLPSFTGEKKSEVPLLLGPGLDQIVQVCQEVASLGHNHYVRGRDCGVELGKGAYSHLPMLLIQPG